MKLWFGVIELWNVIFTYKKNCTRLIEGWTVKFFIVENNIHIFCSLLLALWKILNEPPSNFPNTITIQARSSQLMLETAKLGRQFYFHFPFATYQYTTEFITLILHNGSFNNMKHIYLIPHTFCSNYQKIKLPCKSYASYQKSLVYS